MNVQIKIVGRKVEVEIVGGVTDPAEFAEAVAAVEGQLPPADAQIGGRMPLWGAGMLIAAAGGVETEVATFDPRLGYVVVSGPRRGEVDPA